MDTTKWRCPGRRLLVLWTRPQGTVSGRWPKHHQGGPDYKEHGTGGPLLLSTSVAAYQLEQDFSNVLLSMSWILEGSSDSEWCPTILSLWVPIIAVEARGGPPLALTGRWARSHGVWERGDRPKTRVPAPRPHEGSEQSYGKPSVPSRLSSHTLTCHHIPTGRVFFSFSN